MGDVCLFALHVHLVAEVTPCCPSSGLPLQCVWWNLLLGRVLIWSVQQGLFHPLRWSDGSAADSGTSSPIPLVADHMTAQALLGLGGLFWDS